MCVVCLNVAFVSRLIFVSSLSRFLYNFSVLLFDEIKTSLFSFFGCFFFEKTGEVSGSGDIARSVRV